MDLFSKYTSESLCTVVDVIHIKWLLGLELAYGMGLEPSENTFLDPDCGSIVLYHTHKVINFSYD